jgi:hypothetical protein
LRSKVFLQCSSPGLRQKQATRGGYTNEVIITPPLLTVNMRDTEEHVKQVNFNKQQCVGDGGLFVCENIVTIWFSNERDLPDRVPLGGRCPDCRLRVAERRLIDE